MKGKGSVCECVLERERKREGGGTEHRRAVNHTDSKDLMTL